MFYGTRVMENLHIIFTLTESARVNTQIISIKNTTTKMQKKMKGHSHMGIVIYVGNIEVALPLKHKSSYHFA